MSDRAMKNLPAYTPEEKETIIRTDDSLACWLAYTASSKMMKKFEESNWECVRTDYHQDGSVAAKTYTAPFGRIGIYKKRAKQNLTDEQREERRQRALHMLEAKRKKQEAAKNKKKGV